MNNIHKLVEKACQTRPGHPAAFTSVDLASIFCAMNLEILKLETRIQHLEKQLGKPSPRNHLHHHS